MKNNWISTILLLVLASAMIGLSIFNFLAIRKYRSEIVEFGKELQKVGDTISYNTGTSSFMYLENVKVSESANQMEIKDENNTPIFSFRSDLYVGDKSEMEKTCDALRLIKNWNDKEKVYLSGINCK